MPLFEVTEDGLERRPPAAFAALGLYERADLQRLLRDDISALHEDLLVIADEFGTWEDARRRIDLLALDKGRPARRHRAQADRRRRPHGAPRPSATQPWSPEAAAYQVRLRRKDVARERARSGGRDFTRYHVIVDGVERPHQQAQRHPVHAPVLWRTHPWWGRMDRMMADRQRPFATLLRTGCRPLFVLSPQRRFATSGRPPG